jgi:hypothetical protein
MLPKDISVGAGQIGRAGGKYFRRGIPRPCPSDRQVLAAMLLARRGACRQNSREWGRAKAKGSGYVFPQFMSDRAGVMPRAPGQPTPRR